MRPAHRQADRPPLHALGSTSRAERVLDSSELLRQGHEAQ